MIPKFLERVKDRVPVLDREPLYHLTMLTTAMLSAVASVLSIIAIAGGHHR